MDDAGEGQIPATKPGRSKRDWNASQKAKDDKEARENDPNGVTLGIDAPAIKLAKKTEVGTAVLQDVYPPFTSADGEWAKGWEEGGGKFLGTCGQGCVSLYRRFEDDRVADRVVVKDSMLSGSEWSTWYRWHPDVRDVEGRVPMEVHCLQTLRDKSAGNGDAGRTYAITLRGWRVENDAMWYRLYTA